ncbi:uncharacterized protein LOC124358611 [Homalodisca vitripennis]|uniref:uncharacterized protein LOC124358611 n=1 Tax=Homalodisca vitripennis TaxID=197043 RepID=UPI001EEBC986|nr:uncharacterized protein LOC124358611 [Homalodisca vitripennis]
MMSKFQVYLHDIPTLGRPEKSSSGIRDLNRTRPKKVFQQQNEEPLQKKKADSCGRHHTSLVTPRPITIQSSHLRSHYCLEELRRPQCDRVLRSASQAQVTNRAPDTKGENCDVAFLKKLLAMNKKEELLLNKKLAKLLAEELKTPEVRTGKGCKGCTSLSALSVYNNHDKRLLLMDSTVQGSPSRNRRVPCPPQFDANGRVIFNDSDEEDTEDFNHRLEPKVEFTSAESKTWINTTTVIKTKSDVSGKMCSKKNSLSVINQRPSLQTKSCGRKCGEVEGDSYPRKSFFTASNAYQNYQSQKRNTDQSEVLDNMAAHCCVAVPTKPRKMTKKVWDFNNIPKNKPENSSQCGRHIYTVGLNTFPCCKGDGTSKMIKEDRNGKLKNSRTQIFCHGDGHTRPTR